MYREITMANISLVQTENLSQEVRKSDIHFPKKLIILLCMPSHPSSLLIRHTLDCCFQKGGYFFFCQVRVKLGDFVRDGGHLNETVRPIKNMHAVFCKIDCRWGDSKRKEQLAHF